MSRATIRWVDGDSFDAAAAAGDLVVISFSQRKVMAGQVGDGLDRGLSLSDNPLNVQRFRDSLTFVFEGYERDAAQLRAVLLHLLDGQRALYEC